MSLGKYLFISAVWLLILPVFMAGMGAIFGEEVTQTNTIEDDSNIYTILIGFVTDIGEFSIFGFKIFEGLTTPIINTLVGFSLFPMWLNIILIGLPLILVIRAIASTTG